MVARGLLVSLGVLVLGTRAYAGSSKLAEARDAIAAVRYNDAQPLLAAALDEGGNHPAEVIEIYRLSASTAIVLGQPDVADQFYRRWLALAPDATLPDTVAPKLREPFKVAQLYMASRGRLVVDVHRKTVGSSDQIDVVVET
ncbi:MAG TPA: hypothetical protein VGO00_23985, partial [Kofleriaceae bacterium]|nr:hypothetical protein [Kofleriaceae bacterium]